MYYSSAEYKELQVLNKKFESLSKKFFALDEKLDKATCEATQEEISEKMNVIQSKKNPISARIEELETILEAM